ncbi:conserved exported protein of unknown function [Candidatus Filomicrobium marinum]|uniref:Uncharacterized protein n=1 Tax=Candidatus Filomicrobium marinum TaxID=1608628 RepID=A0A0D6JBM1_9HYPH|nr:TonB-dependent receptor [Candidatus Filomicrobium marinum]CFX02122.1 conserved exported protein of unknown function [Candidatus Filomicrobium marinum]CPR15577.1 conserved exported protein of unknown function [Candidatus Filomicrobium marinum]
MKNSNVGIIGLSLVLMSTPALAQQGEPAAGAPTAADIPPVDVIQVQPKAAPKAQPKAAAKKQAPQQIVSPEPVPYQPEVVDDAPVGHIDPATGRQISNAPTLNPIDPASGILPADLLDYIGAASRVTSAQIDEQRPKDNHEILARVPGVMVVNDDGMSRHSNIGVRGSPVRRSRKVLILEDGQSINFSSYLDPSTHYTPPTDRIEAVEVVRGYNIPFAPLTNHGIINFQNLSPFGPEETVISASIGTTDGVKRDWNNTRHVHTRQHAGNVGAVFSYSGSEAGGAWDNEVLRYNDFYGALGWKGINQDLTVSGVYFRQRDNYDEDNFEGDDSLGISAEQQFFNNGRWKSGNPLIADGLTDLNTYNADYFRLQVAHNWYVDSNTTVSTRIYGSDHERNRFSVRDPAPNFHMRGRNRKYTIYGADSRVEFANLPLFGDRTQDVQAGISYEHHSFRNCTSFGKLNEVLDSGNTGNCFAEDGVNGYVDDGALEKFETGAFTAFLQSSMHLTKTFSVTPGVRFVSYDVKRNGVYAGPNPIHVGDVPYPADTEAGELVGKEESSFNHVLPGVALSWRGIYNTNVYGSYHRGFTPSVARGEFFPLPEEVGDNFQVGVRTTAFKGLTLDLAYFFSRIDDYQIKEAFTAPSGANIFGTVDQAEINGFEIYSRLDSQPYIGGRLNFFGEATYTFADSVITESNVPAEVGKYLPEVPRHFANLTLGVEQRGLWDASVSWTYRGDFYTDTINTPYGGDDEGGQGLVPDVWLLSARANYTVPGTNTTLFVSGQNLTNEFYIADRADGMKPGIGRTLWAGFKQKF